MNDAFKKINKCCFKTCEFSSVVVMLQTHIYIRNSYFKERRIDDQRLLTLSRGLNKKMPV